MAVCVILYAERNAAKHVKNAKAGGFMTIVYISNDINSHILDVCKSLYNILGNDFYFIATDASINSQNAFRKGFAFYNASTTQSKNPYSWYKIANDRAAADACFNIINKSDVAIIANASDDWIKTRLKKGKLTFRAHERWYGRNRLHWYKYPRALLGGWLHHKRFSNLYMLCASAYTAADAYKVNCYKNKAFQWGYFPECKRYTDPKSLITSKDKKEILWCGRFLDWKHPDDAIRAAKKLSDSGYTFHMNFIGIGEMEETLKQLIKNYGLEERITLLGAMTPEKVRTYMESAGIYLFTSDQKEGWGAVLNEAMNSGCSVIASHAIGSVPYLLKNQKNGYIYESGNIEALCKNIKFLLESPDVQEKTGMAAYQTITEEWNAETAAIRLVNLAKHILSGEKSPKLYETGLCSKAENLKDNWFDSAKNQVPKS